MCSWLDYTALNHCARAPTILVQCRPADADQARFFALLALYAVAPGPMGLNEPGYGLLLVVTDERIRAAESEAAAA